MLIIVIVILFKRAANFPNAWSRAFGVTVDNTLLDVPARILQTPGIIYGQVSVEFRFLLSSIFNCDRLRKLAKKKKKVKSPKY